MQNQPSKMRKLFDNRQQKNTLSLYYTFPKKEEISELMQFDLSEITQLRLGSHIVSDEEGSFFAKYYEKIKHITSLTIISNQSPPKGFSSFSLHSWNSLKILNLNYVRIGNKGVKLLTRSGLPNLQTLELSDINMSNAGVIHLVKAYLPRLTTLNISCNAIVQRGMLFLTKLLTRSLRTLQVDYIGIEKYRYGLLLLDSPQLQRFIVLSMQGQDTQCQSLYYQAFPILKGASEQID